MTNSKTISLIICMSIWLIVFSPSTAFSLAGIGEIDSIFHFNQYANLKWAHPGDICDGDDPYCLRLEKVEHEIFVGLEGSLEEINVPENKSIPVIMARRSMDDTWLIYDLANEAYLIEAATFEDASAEWTSGGFNSLSFIDAKNPAKTPDKFLNETDESIRLKWRLKAFSYLPLCLILSIVFGSLAISFHNKYSKSDLKKNLVLSAVFTILFGIEIVFISIFFWAMH